MASAIKWEAAWVDRSTVLTTELNALANNGICAAGTGYDNTSNLDQYAALELSVDFVSAPTSGGYVNIFLVESLDGTNYSDATTTAGDAGIMRFIGAIPLAAVTAAQRIASPFTFMLRPGKAKFVLENKSGQAFPASGSTLKLFTTNDEAQ